MTPYKWIAQAALNMIDCLNYDAAFEFLSKSLAYGVDEKDVDDPMWDHLEDARMDLQMCYGIIHNDLQLKGEDPWTEHMDNAVGHLRSILNS